MGKTSAKLCRFLTSTLPAIHFVADQFDLHLILVRKPQDQNEINSETRFCKQFRNQDRFHIGSCLETDFCKQLEKGFQTRPVCILCNRVRELQRFAIMSLYL